jgi:hypothetical protein
MKRGPGDLSAQHGQLMPEHEDLGVLGVHLVHSDGREHATNQSVEERQPDCQRARSCSSWLVKRASCCCTLQVLDLGNDVFH